MRFRLPWGVAALVAATAACKTSSSRLAVCARGDRAALSQRLAGGTLDIEYLDDSGDVVARRVASADRPSSVDGEFPAGAVSIRIEGLDAAGELVARGQGRIEDQRACVCITLADEFSFFCEGVACREDGDRCEFIDQETGEPDDLRTVILAGSGGDVAVDVADTFLVSESIQSHGGAPVVRLGGEPTAVALVRFPLTAIPPSVEILAADIQWSVSELSCPTDEQDTQCTAVTYRLIEAWDEGALDGGTGCPNWNCRQEGVVWSVPGAGAVDDHLRSRSLTIESAAELGADADRLVVPVTSAARTWHRDPGSNHGVVTLAAEDTALALVSSEGEPALGPRLTLELRLDDPAPYPADAGPADAAAQDGGVAQDMVMVPGGDFIMGCDSARPDCGDNASPAHTVTLTRDYLIDRTEVTQAAYAECVASGSCAVPACDYDPVERPSVPVVCVTYQQAQDYCAFRGKRLPTEAEWERAARGDDERQFPWGNDAATCQRVNFVQCTGVLLPVGALPAGAGPYGALDQAGNAREWVSDYAGTYTAEPVIDPVDPDTAALRGGSLTGSEAWMSTWRRIARPLPSADHDSSTGFRCARHAE